MQLLHHTPNSDVHILMIYTGGTLGMVYDARKRSLVPFNFEQILNNVPEMERLQFSISLLSLPEIIDSSNVKPSNWANLATIIKQHYTQFDAIVILHGTDTMAYSASALSFLLENLSKPVILTGAQLPIGVARTDARENLITALEIAAAKIDGRPIVPEVAIYFNEVLLRGNRASKKESTQFSAFRSENYPHLAEIGVSIDYNHPYLRPYRPDLALKVHQNFDENVVILKLFPAISENVVRSILKISDLRGVILETFGAGNAPTDTWFLGALREAIEAGIVICNVSQCDGGQVLQDKYETGRKLQEIGVVSGHDLTTEAAITKLMFLLAQETNPQRVALRFEQDLCGELTMLSE